MGFQLPLVTYVIAQGPSLDPNSSMNQKNLSLVRRLIGRFETDFAGELTRFSNYEQYRENPVADRIFETNTVDFPKLMKIVEKYKYMTVVLPTMGNYKILRDHADFANIMRFLDEIDYPIIIADEAYNFFDRPETDAVHELVHKAYKLKEAMKKSVEQRRSRRGRIQL